MTATTRQSMNLFPGLTALFLACALVLRIVAAPIILAAPEPGLMAICSGGKIIYVSMETGQPVDPEGGPADLDCPLVIAALAVIVADAPIKAPQAVAQSLLSRPGPLALARHPRCCDYQPRAPPVPV